MKAPLFLIGFLALHSSGQAQNLLPNPGFEAGATQPSGWRLADGAGEWATSPSPDTGRVVRVQGRGEDQSVWRTDLLPLEPGGRYALRFRARRVGEASGGTAVAGTSRVNRDFPLDREWREYHFLFRQPDDARADFVRLGQWHVQGELEFAGAELWPVLVSHRAVGGPGAGELRLGQNEHVSGGVYRFALQLGGVAANIHRPLERSTAGFNSDRWVFTPGAEVVYRFALAGHTQTEGRVRVAINHHVAGTLHVEASRDARQWTPLGTFGSTARGGTCELPAGLLPAPECYVRLRTPDADTALQVNRCDYEARLAGAADREGEGGTDFLEVHQQAAALAVNAFHLDTRRGQGEVRFGLRATAATTESLKGRVTLGGPTAPATEESGQQRFTLEPGVASALDLAVTVVEPGEHELRLRLAEDSGRVLFEGHARARVSHLHDPRAGYRLAGSERLGLWWCESGWKVARSSRPPPATVPVRPVTVAAARGEFEAAQVILRAALELELLAAQTSAWRDAQGQPSPITLRLEELAYVRVTHPTDATCEADWYPDPLPPLRLPCALPADLNFPLWLTFYVPRSAAPGLHRSELTLELRSDGQLETLRLPLVVQVYDFELPRETHLRSALGLDAGAINRYHKLTDRADQVAVFEHYLQNFAEHRLSPYSFYDYAPLEVRFEGEGANQRARVDFTKFDAAATRWLEGPGATTPPDGNARRAGVPGEATVGSPFNTFQLPLRGMGGGTFHSRYLGQLEGFEEGTPEHTRRFQDYLGQVERHLRAQGWLDRAFTYWFDEPDPKDYAFVVAGQQRIKAAAPGLQRMMTEQPEPELLGHVDIWCALTPEWTPEKVRARRDAGEQVWWYICTAPKAPYVTEFIDHPGTELRLWPWQAWQYGIHGMLIWATLWWHSPTAYPDALQDPWEDPMSWVSGYGTPSGTRSPWGNGDGRFLYPPRRNPNTATEPCLERPINSIRWENLRDGMEDYEYFWLLEQEVERVARWPGDRAKGAGAGGDEAAGEPAFLSAARRLLVVPEVVSRDLTHFTTDPRLLLEHRDRMARMIERLRQVR